MAEAKIETVFKIYLLFLLTPNHCIGKKIALEILRTYLDLYGNLPSGYMIILVLYHSYWFLMAQFLQSLRE